MDAKMIEKLKDKLCEELENVSRKSQMTSGDLDSVHKLIVSIEKLMKIEKLDDGEHSHRGGNWNARGSYDNGSYGNGSYGNGSYGNGSYDSGSYDDGSYANRGMHYVRGHYSRAEGSSMVKDHIRKMMDENEISGNDRRILEKAMEILS